MTKRTILFAASLGGVVGFFALPAFATDVRAQLTPELIYDHCLASGVGTETEGTFMLPGGQRLTGTVRCTADDLAVPNTTATRRQHRDDDDDGGNDDHDDDRRDRHGEYDRNHDHRDDD